MSDILPFSQWSELNPTETDPVKKLKNFSDYVRQESWKNGTYSQSTEEELKQGINQKLIESGKFTETTTAEEKDAIKSVLLAPPQNNLDVDARFVYDDMMKAGVYDTSPLSTGDQEILSSYVASRNLAERNKDPVMAAQADSYAEAVGGILANREIINRAKKNALLRGDVSAIALEDNDGNRYVEVGPDADQELIRKETESLIKSGAIAVEDIPNLSLNFQDNGLGSTNTRARRSQGFAEDLNAVVKGDEYLSDLINKEASSLTFREKEAQEGIGEGILSGTMDVLGGVVSTIGGLVTERDFSGTESAIKETMTRSADYREELISALKNNTALADSYSDSEIDTFADDYIKALKGPTYRTDKEGSGISVLSTGVPIIARELALRPEELERQMASANLTDAQKGVARDQRETLANSSLKGTTEFLSRMDDAFVDQLAKSREVGMSDREFVEGWLADEDNYNNFTNRAKALGMETIKAVGTLAVSVPALLGNKQAAETMVGLSNAGQDFSQYAEIFGDRFGVGQQLANIVPSVAVDLLASAGTGGIYAGVKGTVTSAAKGVARNVAVKYAARNAAKVVPQALGNAIGKIDDVAAIAARGVATEAPSVVFNAISKGIGKGLVGAGRFTDNMMSVGPATFLRSAGSTYASIYGQLPSDMSHEAKHEASIGYAVSSGLFTAALTAGMSSIGLGGTEKLVTKNLDDLTFRQVSKLYAQTRRAAANVTDDVIKKAVRQQTAGAFKSLVRDHAEGFASEGFEEGVDQAFQIMVEQAAMNKDTPIREIGKGVFDAFILGGLMGAGTTAIRQATPTLTADGKAQEAVKMERARTELYTSIAKKLTDSSSPKTAEALATAFADADAAAAAAVPSATPPDPSGDFYDPANLDTEDLFERWNPADETTGLMADFVGRKVHYAGQQGILKSDGKGNVYLEYVESKTEAKQVKGKTKKAKTKTSTAAKAKGTKIRVDLGSSAQLAKGIIETPYTALRTKSDIGDVKAGSLVVKTGKVYYALPHIDDITTPPYIVRNSKGEPVGLGFLNVRMVGSNATRDNFMVSFDGPIFDAAKYYGIDFSELSTVTKADNSAAGARQTKEERKKEKEEAKAFRAVLVQPDPETEQSPLDALIGLYEGLDILADTDVEIEDIPLAELINLSQALDDVLNDTNLDPELSKQLAAIHKQVKVARADKEGFVAIANSEYTPISGQDAIEIVDNLPRDFKITNYGLIKIRYDGEDLLVKPVSLNKRDYKITVVIDNRKKTLPIAGTVDKNTFNEVMPEIKARAASEGQYSLAKLRKMSLKELQVVVDLADELRSENPNNSALLVKLNKLQQRVERVVVENEAKAKKQAEKEAAAAARLKKAEEAKAAKATETKGETTKGKKTKVEAPKAEDQEPEKPKEPRTPKKATTAEKEEALKNIAEDTEEDEEVEEDDAEAEADAEADANTEEVPSGPLTDEEFEEIASLNTVGGMRDRINAAISANPTFRSAIIDAALNLARQPQKAGDSAPLNVGTFKKAVTSLLSDPANENKPKAKAPKTIKQKFPEVKDVEEESEEPDDEGATPTKPAKKKVVGVTISVGSGDNYKTPNFILFSLDSKDNVLNPLGRSAVPQIDAALIYASGLTKQGRVTLDTFSASNLPDVGKHDLKYRKQAQSSPSSPIILIKKGREYSAHQSSVNLARIQLAAKAGGEVQVLIVSQTNLKNNGTVVIENKIAKNKKLANQGRLLAQAQDDVLNNLNKKYPDGNNKSITLRNFIDKMDRNTADGFENQYASRHRDAFEAAIEQASKDIQTALSRLQRAELEQSSEFAAARERITNAAEILTRQLAPKPEKVKSNVPYNTPELRPDFRSEAEREEFNKMVEHGYPERNMGPFLGKDATGLTGVAHPADPKTYLKGKSIYLLEKIREIYPVLQWEALNAKSKKPKFEILRRSKSLEYRKDPESDLSSVPVVVYAGTQTSVFTNDPAITLAQLSELGPVRIPEDSVGNLNKSIVTALHADGNLYAVGVRDYAGRNVQDNTKQTGSVRLARLEKGVALMQAIGGIDRLDVVGGSPVLQSLKVPNRRTAVQSLSEYFQQSITFFEGFFGKDVELLNDLEIKAVNDSIVQLTVDVAEFVLAYKLASKALRSKQFSKRINKTVTEADIAEAPLTLFAKLSDLTSEDIEAIITPEDVLRLIAPRAGSPRLERMNKGNADFIKAYEAKLEEANGLENSIVTIKDKGELKRVKGNLVEMRGELMADQRQYNDLIRERNLMNRRNEEAVQNYEKNQASITQDPLTKKQLSKLIESYYPSVTADNSSNLLRDEARHNYVLKRFGAMMSLKMADPSFGLGPKPAKIITDIFQRYRASVSRSQTGATTVSIEQLVKTSSGGFTISESNPNAGLVLDSVMTEIEMIEDVMSKSYSETLHDMLVLTAKETPQLKSQLFILGQKLDSGVFSKLDTETDAEDLIEILGQVMSNPKNQAQVIRQLKDLPSTSEGRKMFAILSMMGWAPDPSTIAGIRVPTEEDVVNSGELNTDKQLRDLTREDIKARLGKLESDRKQISDDGEAYAQAMRETLASPEGEEVRRLFADQNAYDKELASLNEIRYLMAQFKRSDDDELDSSRRQNVTDNERAIGRKITKLNQRVDQIDLNIGKHIAFINGVGPDSNVFDPAPRIAEVSLMLESATASLDSIVVTGKPNPEEKALAYNYGERKAERDELSETLQTTRKVRKLKRDGNLEAEQARLGELNTYLENKKEEYERAVEKIRLYENSASEKSQANDRRDKLKQELEALKKLAVSPQLQQMIAESKALRDKLAELKNQEQQIKEALKGELSNEVYKDFSNSNEVDKQLASMKALKAARDEVTKATGNYNKQLARLSKKGVTGDDLVNQAAKQQAKLEIARDRLVAISSQIGPQLQLSQLNEDARVIVERRLADNEKEIQSVEEQIAKLSGATASKVKSNKRIVESLEAERNSVLGMRDDLAEFLTMSKAISNPNNAKNVARQLKSIQNRITQYTSLKGKASDKVRRIITDGFILASGQAINKKQVKKQVTKVSQGALLTRLRSTYGVTDQTARRTPDAVKSAEEALAEAQLKQSQAGARLRDAQGNLTKIYEALENKPTKKVKQSLESQLKSSQDELGSAQTEMAEASSEVTRLTRLAAQARAASKPLYSMSAVDIAKSSVVSIANEAEIEKLGLTDSPIVALENIAKSGPPHLRLLAKMILRNKEALDGLAVIVGRFNHRTAGFQTRNYVVINLDGHNGKGVADVLVHEVVHFLTREALSNPEVAAMVDKLRDLAASRLIEIGEDISDYLYALDSNEEFLSAVFTDQKLQEALDVTDNGSKRSLLQRVIDFILRVFNADNMQTKTAMRELIKLTQESIDDRVYGNRAVNQREARTARLDRQTNERARGFIDRLLAQEDALFASDEGLSGRRFTPEQRQRFDGLRQDAIEALLRREGRFEDIGGLDEDGETDIFDTTYDPDKQDDQDRSDNFTDRIKRLTETTKAEEVWESSVDEIGRLIGFDFFDEYAEIERRADERAKQDPRFTATAAQEMGVALEFVKDAQRAKAEGRTTSATGLSRQEIAEMRAVGKLRQKDPLTQLEVLFINARDFFVAGPVPLYKYDGFLATERDMYPSSTVVENYRQAFKNMREYFMPVFESDNQELIDKATNLIDAWADVFGNKRFLGPARPKRQGPLLSPSVIQDIDLESRIRSHIPAGMTLVADTKLLGAMGVSDTGIIYYNPDLVAASVDGYDAQIADQMISVMVTHEVSHAAANAVMAPQDYDDIATELGREELDKIASKYYSLTYPDINERAAAMEEDRQNGDLDDRRIAAEFVRMEIEKAIVGSTSEDLLNRFAKKPSIITRIAEAIREFVSSMTRRQERDFSLKIAADISRASRVAAELLNGGSLPAAPEPSPTFGHAGELVDAAVNGSHQMLYLMRIADADKASKASNSIFSRLGKMASALPREISKFIKEREAELNANRLYLDRFAPQYRYYLERALKNGANIDDVAKMFGSTSPTLDEATEAKISTQVENFRNSISNDDKGKSDKVRKFRERATLNAVKKNTTDFRKAQNDAEARLNAIAPEFVTLVKRFRAELDKRQIAIGYDDDSKGIYLTRTYKFFNTEGWAAAARSGGKYEVNGEAVDFDALREQAAKVFEGQVRAEYLKEGKALSNDTLRREVFNKMDALLATLETEARKDKGESISQDTTRSLTKGPLDPALRQLLGETVNPFENAVRTFGYLSMLDVNKQALTSIREALIASGYGVETERVGYTQVFGKGKSEALAPLAGLYVREDIAKELEAEFAGSASRLLNHNEKVMQQVGRGLAKLSGLSMTAKTLMGVGFFTRNGVTNQIILPLAQGIIPNPVHIKKSYSLAWLANFESSGRNATEEVTQEMTKLTRLGIMRDSLQRGTFEDMFKVFADRSGTTYESVVDDIVKAAQEADYKSLMGIAEQLKKYAGKGIDVLASLNGWMDDAAKVQVFYFERAELKAAYPNKTEDELDQEASEKVKMTMPGHIEQLDIVKKFNRSPFALQLFPFARWKTEVLRTLVNSYKLSYSELFSGNPRMRFRGMRRLAGNMTVVFGGSTIGGTILATIFSRLIDDEDEEKKGKLDPVEDESVKASLRLALPEWQRGHTLSMSTNGRELRVVDMTAMMPYATVSDSINIIREGLNTGKGIDARGVANYWATQFVGSQIAAGAIADVVRNKDDFDKNIYEQSDTITAASLKVLNHIYTQSYEPSVIKKARQVTREGEQEKAAIIYGELLGARPVSYTLDRVASSGFYNLKDQVDSAKRLRSPLSSGRFISDEDFTNTMTEAQEYEDNVQAQMFQFTKALTSLGYDERSIVLSAANAGNSKKRVRDAMSGINTAWSGGPDWLKTMTFNVEKSGEDDPRRRYELLRSTFEALPPMVDVTGQ